MSGAYKPPKAVKEHETEFHNNPTAFEINRFMSQANSYIINMRLFLTYIEFENGHTALNLFTQENLSSFVMIQDTINPRAQYHLVMVSHKFHIRLQITRFYSPYMENNQRLIWIVKAPGRQSCSFAAFGSLKGSL